jgi:hypothetical protein
MLKTQIFIFYLLIFLFSENIKAQVINKDNFFKDNFIEVNLETSNKNHYIFFNSTKKETLRKYRKAKVNLVGNKSYKAQFRSRGIQGAHYNNTNRSIKIKLKNSFSNKQFKDKKYKTYNFNSIFSDPFLRDPIAYSIWSKYNFLSLESNLAIMSVNNEFNGVKILYENLDDELLWRNGIKNGSMYREGFAGALDSSRGWMQQDYLHIWKKQSLRRHKDIDDWITFLISNSKNGNEFYQLLEKNIDIEKYLKWMALNTILGGNHHVTDHNIVFFNNFEKQKFESIIYDPAGFDLYRIDETIRYFNNNFNSKILVKNEYWNKYIFYLYEFLSSFEFENITNESIDYHYSKLKKILLYTVKEKNLSIENIYPHIIDKKYIAGDRPLKLNYKKCKNNQKNYNIDCIINLNKSEIKKFNIERKASILKEIEEIKFYANMYEIKNDYFKINYQNNSINTKSNFTIFLKTKSLSNNKIEEIILKSNTKYKKNNKFYLCNDVNFDQIVNENEKCFLSQIIEENIKFSLVNDNIILKSHIFQNNHNNHTKTSVFGNVENNYKSDEKNFIVLADSNNKELNNNISFSSFSLINLNTSKTKSFKTENSKNILLDNSDIIIGPNDDTDFRINISKNRLINSSYKIEFTNKPEWVKILKDRINIKPPNNSLGTHILEFKIFNENGLSQNYLKKIIVKPWSRISKILSNYNINLAKYFERNALRQGVYGKVNLDLKQNFFRLKGLYYNIFNFQSYFSRRGYNLDKSIFKKNILESNKKIIWGPNEIINIKNNTILPISSSLEIKPGTKILIDKKKAIIFHGKVSAIGSKNKPIIFTSSNKNENFGAIIFNHNSVNGSKFKNVIVEKGKDFSWGGRLYTGALNVYNSSLQIDDSIFRYNAGDDAINIKYSKSMIKNSELYNNYFDAIDSDFSNIELFNSTFKDNGNDGVDLNNSIAYIENNKIISSGDKGISVGEESYVFLKKNIISKNNIGLANKDESYVEITNDLFTDNNEDIIEYIKKKNFGLPKTVKISN